MHPKGYGRNLLSLRETILKAGKEGLARLNRQPVSRFTAESMGIIGAKKVPDDHEDLILRQAAVLQVTNGIH